MIGKLNIRGVIGMGGISLLDVITQVTAQKDAVEFEVYITSPGGEVQVGFDINAYLKSLGSKITTVIQGQCASIATVIALAGSSRKMETGSEFFIHNPWATVEGDADQLQEYSDAIRDTEKKLIDFYSKNTSITKEGLDALMKQQTGLTPEQALQLGFITEIIPQGAEKFAPLKAVAIITKTETMTKEAKAIIESNKTVIESIKTFIAKVTKAIAGEEPKVVNMDLTTTEGVELHVETSVEGEINIGDAVTDKDGNDTPDATYNFPDKSVMVTDADSKVKEYTKAEAAADPAAPTPEEALATASAKIVELEASNKELVEGLTVSNNALKEFDTKMNTLSNYKPKAIKVIVKAKEEPKIENKVEEGKERKKEYKPALTLDEKIAAAKSEKK